MKKIYESGENYLETILMLKKKNGNVRSIDIAKEMGFSKPSVSRAINILKDEELILVDGNGNIEFTVSGLAKAEKVLERHLTITAFLQNILGVDPETAENDACRIEHIISNETFDKIKALKAKLEDE
jgi:Mn-dependent DtxR family transcriptional regulator